VEACTLRSRYARDTEVDSECREGAVRIVQATGKPIAEAAPAGVVHAAGCGPRGRLGVGGFRDVGVTLRQGDADGAKAAVMKYPQRRNGARLDGQDVQWGLPSLAQRWVRLPMLAEPPNAVPDIVSMVHILHDT